MANCDSTQFPDDVFAPPMSGGAALASETELGFAQTVTLNAVDDTFTYPVLDWRSVGLSVEAGSVDVSFDLGVTYTSSYSSSSSSVVFGQGNISPFDPSLMIIKATSIDTTIQVIGDYVA